MTLRARLSQGILAPEIDDPEGEAVPGYPQPPVNEANNAKPLSDTTNQISTSTEESAEEGPPRKKTKITDVSIHGEIFDENNLLAEKAQEKKQKTSRLVNQKQKRRKKGKWGKQGREGSIYISCCNNNTKKKRRKKGKWGKQGREGS